MEPFPGVTLGLLGVTLGGITPSNLSLLVVDTVWFATSYNVWCVWFAPFGHHNGAKQCANQNLQNLTFVPPVPVGHQVDGLPPRPGGASWLPGTPLVATRLWPISGFEARAPGSSRHPGPEPMARATIAERK